MPPRRSKQLKDYVTYLISSFGRQQNALFICVQNARLLFPVIDHFPLITTIAWPYTVQLRGVVQITFAHLLDIKIAYPVLRNHRAF